LNSGPPVPQTGALTGLRYAPPMRRKLYAGAARRARPPIRLVGSYHQSAGRTSDQAAAFRIRLPAGAVERSRLEAAINPHSTPPELLVESVVLFVADEIARLCGVRSERRSYRAVDGLLGGRSLDRAVAGQCRRRGSFQKLTGQTTEDTGAEQRLCLIQSRRAFSVLRPALSACPPPSVPRSPSSESGS
jgi:hypothetical protein